MSASPIPDSACRNCGEELASGARFCSNCGAPTGDLPPVETVPGPVVHESVERRWLGLPARFVLLCLGFAAFGASIGLFATGSWAWGIVMVLLAVALLAALAETTRRNADVWVQHSTRLAADGRAHAVTAAEVWRTRLDSRVSRWRTQSRLDAIAVERGPALQALGEAAWRKDKAAEREARQRLVDLEQEGKRIEDEFAERLAGADERIRRARLPVQDTVIAADPDQPASE
jgi:membrane protein implicated in regulation of membrane protease activity